MARDKRRLHSACYEVEDTSETPVDVTGLALGGMPAFAEVRAQALLEQNAGILRDFGVSGHVRTTRGKTYLVLKTSGLVGAVPLLSPLTARVDYGLIIRPRFGWTSIGEVLWQTGLRVVPEIIRLPPLPTSERRIPPWVLSSVVIARVEALLRNTTRSFKLVDEDLRRPRGRVDWSRYTRTHLARGRADIVPCRYQDLVADEPLLRAIAFTLQKHLGSLQSQRHAGAVVIHLIERCKNAQRRLEHLGVVEPKVPSEQLRAQWRSAPWSTRAFLDGLEAIDWTVDERGLAGLGELGGIPWRLSMEQFFEAWVETIAGQLGRSCGLSLEVGRRGETRTALNWKPEWLSGQRSLIPDVVLRGEQVAVVLDAKYKRHLDALLMSEWSRAPEMLREAHRSDLLQVLAYSSLLDSRRVIACLAYPCEARTYEVLEAQRATYARARLQAGERAIDLIVMAAPLHRSAEVMARNLQPLIDRP